MTLEEAKDYLYATLKVLTKNTDEEIRAYIEMLETESPKMTIAELEKEIAKLKECGIPLEGIKQMKEPCDDAISRQAVEEMIKAEMPERGMWEIDGDKEKETVCEVCVDLMQKLSKLPLVTPQPKIGRWIYDDIANNWRCDKCGETPKTMGYVGTDKFMAEHFKFCNHCGAKMESEGV